MAVLPEPGSEIAAAGAPGEDGPEHPTESPQEWGWHGEWGKTARIAGWVCVVLLCLLATTTHYNGTGELSLFGFAAALVLALLWDARRRRTAWRK